MSVKNPVLKGTKCPNCSYGMDTLTAECGDIKMWCSICGWVKGDLMEKHETH